MQHLHVDLNGLSPRPGNSQSDGRAKRQKVRKMSRSRGECVTERFLAPLAMRSRGAMRSLSLPETFRLTASEAGNPLQDHATRAWLQRDSIATRKRKTSSALRAFGS